MKNVIKEILMLLILYVLCVSCSRTVKDVDGNVYHTVKIGKQVWMKENLRTTHYADGTEIAEGGGEDLPPYRFEPEGDLKTCGYLYNWTAAMHSSHLGSEANPSGVQGVCPDGWHVPSKAEVEELLAYCRDHYAKDGKVGKALASKKEWMSDEREGSVGYKPSQNNASGFSAIPVGARGPGSSDNYGLSANFWTTTRTDHGNAFALKLLACDEDADLDGSECTSVTYGYSVRCVKDENDNTNQSKNKKSGRLSDTIIHFVAEDFSPFNGKPAHFRCDNYSHQNYFYTNTSGNITTADIVVPEGQKWAFKACSTDGRGDAYVSDPYMTYFIKGKFHKKYNLPWEGRDVVFYPGDVIRVGIGCRGRWCEYIDVSVTFFVEYLDK